MNSKNQHPSDETINRELNALREFEPSKTGRTNAIEAMRKSTPKPTSRRLALPLGTAAVVAAGVLTLTLTPQRASANNLKLIAEAQGAQQTRYAKTFVLDDAGNPYLKSEEWIEGSKQSQTTYDRNGKTAEILRDNGKNSYSFYEENRTQGTPKTAFIDDCRQSKIELRTFDAYQRIPEFSNFQLEKATPIDGDVFDLYSFAGGNYQVYVNPETLLPVRREIFRNGKLAERAIYTYPEDVDDSLFSPIQLPGAQIYDYPAKREELYKSLAKPIETKEINGKKVELRGAVLGPDSIAIIYKLPTPPQIKPGQLVADIPGYPTKSWATRALTLQNGEELSVVILWQPKNEWTPEDIPVRLHIEGSSVEFNIAHLFQAPLPERLIWRPESNSQIEMTKDNTQHKPHN